MGTVDYVAPEQIVGDHVDGRADVYALGCLLFESLTGTLPFAGASDVAVVYAHLEQPPPRATERRPSLPPAVDDVLARAMAKDPDDRQPTCGGLVEEVRHALGLVHTGASAGRRAAVLIGAAAGGRRRGRRRGSRSRSGTTVRPPLRPAEPSSGSTPPRTR